MECCSSLPPGAAGWPHKYHAAWDKHSGPCPRPRRGLETPRGPYPTCLVDLQRKGSGPRPCLSPGPPAGWKRAWQTCHPKGSLLVSRLQLIRLFPPTSVPGKKAAELESCMRVRRARGCEPPAPQRAPCAAGPCHSPASLLLLSWVLWNLAFQISEQTVRACKAHPEIQCANPVPIWGAPPTTRPGVASGPHSVPGVWRKEANDRHHCGTADPLCLEDSRKASSYPLTRAPLSALGLPPLLSPTWLCPGVWISLWLPMADRRLRIPSPPGTPP